MGAPAGFKLANPLNQATSAPKFVLANPLNNAPSGMTLANPTASAQSQTSSSPSLLNKIGQAVNAFGSNFLKSANPFPKGLQQQTRLPGMIPWNGLIAGNTQPAPTETNAVAGDVGRDLPWVLGAAQLARMGGAYALAKAVKGLPPIPDELPHPTFTPPEPTPIPVFRQPNMSIPTTRLADLQNTVDNQAQNIKTMIPKAYDLAVKNASNGAGSMQEYIAQSKDLAKVKTDELYNSKSPYDDVIPSASPLRNADVEIRNPLNVNGDNYSAHELQMVQKHEPDLFQTMLPDVLKNEKVNPLRNFFDKDDYKLIATNGATKPEFIDTLKNPNIGNLHDFSKHLNMVAKGMRDPGDRATFFNASQRIRDELIKPELARQDAINGTNTLDPYSAGDEFYKNHLKPFDATHRLSEISEGAGPPASHSEILGEIEKGESGLRKFQRNEATGRKVPLIQPGHFLTTLKPDLRKLSQFEANQDLSNLTHGTSNLDADGINKVIGKAQENRFLPFDHPISQLNRPLTESLNKLNIEKAKLGTREAKISKAYAEHQAMAKQIEKENNDRLKEAVSNHKAAEKAVTQNNNSRVQLQIAHRAAIQRALANKKLSWISKLTDLNTFF